MSWKETIFHKNKNFRFVLQCLFLYGACYLLYYCTSIGLDSADLRLASRQLLPPMLIFYVVQRVSGKTLLSRLWLTQFLTGMSWVITTPLLMYIQVGATATKLESMADMLPYFLCQHNSWQQAGNIAFSFRVAQRSYPSSWCVSLFVRSSTSWPMGRASQKPLSSPSGQSPLPHISNFSATRWVLWQRHSLPCSILP